MNRYTAYKEKAYRFTKLCALKETIKMEELRLTRVGCLNDPLDCGKYLLPLPYDLFIIQPGFTEYALNYANDTVLSSLYVCSFSKNYCSHNSYLLWSHYANNHNDVCFEIDFSKNDFLDCPREITYYPLESIVTTRNEFPPGKVEGNFIVLTKSNLWEYEEEVRLIVDIKPKRPITSKFRIDSDSKHLYVPFNLKIISKVIFGVNTLDERIQEVIKIFESKRQNPEYEKMQINPTTLKLEPKQINE